MADVADNVPVTDPVTAISQGKRHLLVRDYSMAVSTLAQACELLAKKHGDTADELGEPYLLYGRALLGLAREEAGVLGGGVPGSEEAQENEDDDEDEDEAEEEEKLSKVDEEEEENEEEEQSAPEETAEKDEAKTNTASPSKEAKESSKDVRKEDEKLENKTKDEEDKSKASEGKEVKEGKDEKKLNEEKKEKEEKEEKVEKDESKAKPEEEKTENAETKEVSKEVGSSATSQPTVSSTAQQNGDIQNGEHDTEDITKEDEEDEVNNLQVAWEVLELAKLVLEKRGPSGWKLLADSYRLLGEVAMEGGNHKGALNDLQRCLELLEKLEPREPRAIAEIHYQLGLAHSLGNDFDASIEEFNKATMLLESRIKELGEMKEPPKTDDPFYTIEGEIQELKDLLPEIQDKITDMKDFKQEACKMVIESLRNEIAGPSTADSPATSTSKPASDISHLVRKKRKAEDTETEVESPCKKPVTEKAV